MEDNNIGLNSEELKKVLSGEIKIDADKIINPLPESRSMYSPTSSQFDEGFIIPEEDSYTALEDYRASMQPNSHKIVNGVLKGLGTATTSFVENIGSIISVPTQMIYNAADDDEKTTVTQALYKNWLGNTSDAINDYLRKELPNYYSSAEKELGAFEQMIPGSGGALNFWSDKFLNGAGYFVGAAITPWGIESGLSKLGLKQATKNIIKNGADDILKASAGKTLGSAAELNNVFKIAGVGTLMSHGESAVESRQIFNETLEKLQQQKEKGLNNYTEEQMWDIATSAGNTGYLGNMMVTMPTNVLQFAKFIPGIEDMKFLNSSNKFLKPGKEFGEVLIEKPGIFSSLGKFTEGFIEEGGQELLQLGIQKGTQEYYLTKYDPESNFNWYNALQNSFIKATKELGSKEGLESIFLGGILGGPAQVIQGKSSDKSELLEATNVQNSFKNIKNSIQNLSTVAVARNENLNALKEDNTEKYYDSKDKEFKALVQTVEENGGTEILIKQLEDLKNSKGEDISNFLNLPNYLSDGTLRRKVDDIISLVKDYSSVHKNLKSKYSEFYNSEKGKPVFNVLYDAITGFRNINSRIAKLSLELSNLSQQELVFNELEFKENPEYRNEFLEKANDFVTEINKLNPDLTSEIIDKVKGLTYLSLTKRNEYLKDYSKALENPEEIIATAEQAQKNSNKENFEKETDTVKDEPVITPESLFGPEPTEEELKTSETPENIENSTPTEENEFLKLADNAVNEKELDAITDQATQANKYTEELLQRIYNRRNILKQKEKLEKLVKDLEYSSIDELLKDINKNIFNNTKTKKEIAFLSNIEDLAKQAKNISNQIKEKELSASIEDDNDNEEKAGIYYDGEFDGAKPRTNFKTITREYLDKEDTIINKENTVLNFINWLRNFNVVDKNNFRFLAITAKNNKKLHDILISDPKFSGTEGVFMVLATENENGEWVPVKLDEEENRKNYIFTGIVTDRTINDSLEDAEEYKKWRQSLLDSTEPVVVSIQNKSKGVYSTVKIFDEALDKYVRAKRNVLGTISNLETFSDIDLHIGIKEGETIYGNFRVPKNGVGRLYVTKLGSNENPISIPVDLISRTLEQKEVNTAYEIIRSLMNPVKNQDSKKLLKALKALIVLKADDTNLNYRIGFKENKFDTIIVADKEFTKDNLDEQFIKSFLSNKKFNASNDYILKENPNQPFTTVEIDNAGILIDKEYINYKDYLFSNKGREQAPFTTDVATYDKNNAPTEDAIGKTTAEYPKGLYIIFDPTIVSLNNTVNTKNQTLSSESNTNTNPEPIPTIPVTPITELDKLNAEVVRLVNIRNNDKTVRQAIIDSNNGKITLEELDAITKKWDDENGLTAAIKAYDAEKKKQSAPAVPISDKKADIEKRIIITGTDNGFTIIDTSNKDNANSGTLLDVRRRYSDDRYIIEYGEGDTAKTLFSDLTYGKKEDSFHFYITDKKTNKKYYVVGIGNRVIGNDADRNGSLFASIEDTGNITELERTVMELALIDAFEKQVKKRPNIFAPIPQEFIDKVNTKYNAELKAGQEQVTEPLKDVESKAKALEGVAKEDVEIRNVVDRFEKKYNELGNTKEFEKWLMGEDGYGGFLAEGNNREVFNKIPEKWQEQMWEGDFAAVKKRYSKAVEQLLGKPKEAVSVSDKKAYIERRRQGELLSKLNINLVENLGKVPFTELNIRASYQPDIDLISITKDTPDNSIRHELIHRQLHTSDLIKFSQEVDDLIRKVFKQYPETHQDIDELNREVFSREQELITYFLTGDNKRFSTLIQTISNNSSLNKEIFNIIDKYAPLEKRENSLKEYKEINAEYDAEYLDAVKKGEMTKEQAMQALETIGRKDSKAYAELAALEGTQTQSAPVATVSDIKAKKADIERRIVELQKRLDEDKYEKEKEDILNSLTKGFLPTGFRFGSSIGIIEKYISEEDRWISVVDNIMALDKDPIKAIDKYFNQQGLGQKISNANTEYKKQIKPFEEKEEQEDKDITDEQIKLLSTKKGILIRKDWSLGKGLGYTGEGTDGIVEIDEDENGNKFEAEYYLTGENDEWIESSYFLGKTKQEVIDKINAKYDAELAKELYKEMKAGKLVTDMTPAEQQVADKYITEELRKSVDAELDALEGAKPAVSDVEKLQSIKGTLRVDLGGFSIDNLSKEAYDNLIHATADPFYKNLKKWISEYRKTQKPFAVVDSSEIIKEYTFTLEETKPTVSDQTKKTNIEEVKNIGGNPFNGFTLTNNKFATYQVNNKNEVEIINNKSALAAINSSLPTLYDWAEFPNTTESTITVIKKPIVSFDKNGEVIVKQKGEIIFDAELKALESKPNKDISENIPTPLSKYYSKESLTEKPDLGITSEQPSIEELKKKRFSKKDDSFESPDKLDMVAKPGKPIDIEKEIAWFKSKLGFSPEIINDLIENYSLGRVIYYGKTLISDKAIEGTAYHEAFHNVSQFLLTDKELSLLYSEARNKYPNLTDLEIEEILAEDFRKYKLNGKILDKEPIKKSLFDKILQFIKNLLNLNATSLQEVYERLDSGFYSGKKQVNNSSLLQSKKIRELNKTNVLTEKFIQDVISTIDVKIGNVLLTGDRKNYSPDQLVDLSNNLNKTLNTIYNEFIDDYDSLLNKETLSKQEESQVYNLYTILDNWSDIENIYKEDLSTFGLDIEEDVDEQKITNRSNDFSEKKNDVNPKENISKNTRFLIRFLPKMEFYRNPLTKKLDTKKVINDLGYPTSVEFNEVFGKLLNNLSDSPSGDFESFYNKLLDLSKTDATIRELTNRIKKPQDTISEEDIDLQSSILQDINRHKTNAKILNYQSDGNVFIVDANRQGLENQIQESWRQNIKNKINDRRKGFFPRTLLKENPLIYKEEIEQFKNKVLPLSKTNDIDDKFKFLEEFGIILSKPTKDIIKDPDTNIKISKIFNNAIRELEIALEPNKLGTYDLDIKDILSTTSTALGRIQDLLEIEAAFNTKLVEFSYLNSENETEYSLELFNYFSNVASIINDQNIKTKTELFEKLPHLKSVTNKNSSWLNAMFNLKEERVPNVKILINYANGSKITNNSNSGKLTSSLNEPEKIIQDFNMLLLDGISSSIRAADASSEYTVNLNNFKSGTSRQHLPIPISNFNKNLNDIVELKTIFKGYFLDELNRIIEYKNGLGSNIKVFNKEGGKWDIFSEMSDELKTIIESKIEEKEDSISIYNSLQEPINDYIVNFLENEINNYKDKLDFFNIITDPFNTGVSTKLLRDENNQIKYSIDSLISAFIVNDYINSVEQLKLFFGDLAFYKDFFKRTKGAIGTKSMPRNDKYINDWFAKYYESNPRLDGKIKDLDKINVAIVSDIKIKSLYTDNYFKIINDNFGKELAQETKNLFENTNEPDGQGLFMPDECYMFRKKLGKMPRAEKNQWMYEFAWTRNDRKLYTDKQKEEGLPEKDIQLIKNYEDKIKTGKIEEYPLQVIKAQYFGPSYNVSNLFSPTFHKYSLLPLTWRLVKGTNLEEQYLRMEKQQIGYLVFDSVVKVGNVLNKENKQDTFYDSEGNISKKEFTPQIISYNFLGEQVKVSLPKDKVTFGTQMRKLIWGHLFNEGTAINNKFQNYLNKYTDLNNSLINLNKTKLLKDLGIIPEIKKSDEIEKDNQIDISILDLRNNPIDYTEGQKKALSDIEKIINKPGDGYYLLAGYAGTGKTTIAENIAKYGKESGKSILVVAPTNKAAKVLNDKLKSTGVESEAQTIHKTIYGEPDPITGEWIPSANIKNSVIIVDESSMIEDSVMQDLLKLTKDKNNKIIFMGDSFQLEAVGKDSGLFQNKIKEINKGTELTEVKRQSLDSNILKIATLIREDKKSYIPEISTEDFIVAKSKNEFVENFKSSIKNNEDSIMIVATNNERILMNKLARDAKFGENSKNILNENENLISIANSTDYSNSETFSIKKLNDTTFDKFTITLKDNFNKESNYDVYFTFIVNDKNIEIPMLFLPEIDKPSLYHSSILQAARESNKNLYNALEPYTISSRKGIKLSPNIIISTYGYSITAHKSQGSQWEKVFVNQNYSAPTWNPARWFYTAITRAAKQVEVLPSSYNTLIKNEEINEKINNLIQSTEQQGSARKTYSGKITTLKDNQIFVFGSNIGSSKGGAPTHGAGAAKLAKERFGAIQGKSRGIQGKSYAIVTKKYYDVEKSSTPQEIIEEIKGLYEYAKQNPTKEFLVSDYSKSNLNGYTGQEMANMFKAAGPIPSNIVFNENFDKLIGFTQSDIETSKELDEPVLPEIVYSQKNVTKLVNMLREEAVDRNLAKNIIDAFDTETVYENGKKTIKLRYYVDSMVNRNKVNSLLTSIINNRLIKQKINGDAMVQAANTGWESIGKRNISTSNFLKFYRESKEGDTLPAEVMQPVGKNYKPLLEKYGTLDKLNSKIEQAINLREESLEALKANEELNDLYNSITIVGYRIPTQGTNSIEYMIIRKFLPGASNTIILPSEITTKSGGDFDIDKLNVFRKKIIYDELNKGKLNIINNNNIEEIKNFLENSIKELNNYTEDLELDNLINQINPVFSSDLNGKLTKEYVNLLKNLEIISIQNEIINLYEDILKSKENLKNLIIPNSTSIFSSMFDKLDYSKKETSKNKSIGYVNKLKQFYQFMSGKAGVGIGAVNSTFNVLAQVYGLYITPKYEIAPNKYKYVNVNLPHDLNISKAKTVDDKYEKSEVFNQDVNITVDVARNPELVFDLNLGEETAGIFMFLTHIGVNPKVSIAFLNQPIIKKYLNDISSKINMASQAKNQNFSKTQIQKSVLDEIVYDYNLKLNSIEDKKFEYLDFKSMDSENVLTYLINFIKNRKENQNNYEYIYYQIQFLKNFVNYKEYSNLLRDNQSAVNFDTAGLDKDLFQSIFKLNDVSNTIKLGFIPNISKIINNSFISNFNQHKFAIDVFSSLYYVHENKDVEEALISFSKLISYKPDETIDKIVSDYINFVVQRYGEYKDQKISDYRLNLMTGEDSLPKRIQQIKNKPTSELSSHDKKIRSLLFIKEIFPQFDNKDENSGVTTDNLKFFSRKIDTKTNNRITESLKELQSIDIDLYNDIVIMGMLQSGVRNSPITYYGVLNHEVVGNIIKESFKNQKENNKFAEDLKIFMADFLNNNYRFDYNLRKASKIDLFQIKPKGNGIFWRDYSNESCI